MPQTDEFVEVELMYIGKYWDPIRYVYRRVIEGDAVEDERIAFSKPCHKGNPGCIYRIKALLDEDGFVQKVSGFGAYLRRHPNKDLLIALQLDDTIRTTERTSVKMAEVKDWQKNLDPVHALYQTLTPTKRRLLLATVIEYIIRG